MKLSPNYQLSVLSEDEYTRQMPHICDQLEQLRQEGTFSGFDGKDLYYEYFLAENARGTVVVVHGLSEFTRKFYEFSWYMLNQGFNVFLYDQRGHGRSCRLTPCPEVLHVDHFSHYQKDLDRFVTCVVQKAVDGPMYLFAHSMGCAAAAQYLARHPGVFEKAVFSAPMIEPLTRGIPAWVARTALTVCTLFTKGKQRFWFTSEFDPAFPFERSHDKSYARFKRNMDIRISDAHYRTTPLSLRLAQQTVAQRFQLTRKGFLNKITTPILMICAQCEDMVSAEAQAVFAKKCSVCRQVILPNAYHGMLCGTQETINAYMQLMLDHFR